MYPRTGIGGFNLTLEILLIDREQLEYPEHPLDWFQSHA